MRQRTWKIKNGLPDRNRTCNPQLRRLVLYPVELRADAIGLTLGKSPRLQNTAVISGRGGRI